MEEITSKFDFESLYENYPNKEGKKRGMINAKMRIKTQEEFDRFKRALANYLDICQKENRTARGYVKMWVTFVNNWEDYEVTEFKSTGNKSLMEMIDDGQI